MGQWDLLMINLEWMNEKMEKIKKINNETYINMNYLQQIIRDRIIEYREQSTIAENENKHDLKNYYTGCKLGLVDLYKTELK